MARGSTPRPRQLLEFAASRSSGDTQHSDAGWRSAVIYSILVSCRRRGVNPQQYLTDVLDRLPTANTSDIQDLLPANWKPPTYNSS
jgi:hypothetical protein